MLLLSAFPRAVKCGVRSEVVSGLQITLMDTDARPAAVLERDVLPHLNPEEQARYRTFTHPLRRQTWLAGRALLLASLQRYLESVTPAALQTAANGSVHYADADVRLSLSHSGTQLAVALSSGPVGVDIEWSRPRNLVQRPAEVFTANEAARMQALSDSQRQDAFYILWTLKEAACKAAGLSLWECLRSTCFDTGNGTFSTQSPFPAEDWRFVSLQFAPHWILGLAAAVCPYPLPGEIFKLDAASQWQLQTPSAQIELRRGRQDFCVDYHTG